jgi:hypothetical protein
MDTNIEDNVHRLRLRLIDSVKPILHNQYFAYLHIQELNHQRQSTNEYIKRTRMYIVFEMLKKIFYY